MMTKYQTLLAFAFGTCWLNYSAAQSLPAGALTHQPLHSTHTVVLVQEPADKAAEKKDAPAVQAAAPAPAHVVSACSDCGCDGFKCRCNITWLKPWTCEDLEMKPFEPGAKFCGCKGLFHCPKKEEEKKEENGNGEEKKEEEKKDEVAKNGEKKNGEEKKEEAKKDEEKKNGNGEEKKEEEKEPEIAKTPLLAWIQCACPSHYEKMTKRGDNLYGWVQMGVTGNFDSPRNRTNFGTGYNWRSNDFQLNQAFLVYENTLEQDDTVNFGYHISTMIGTDAPFNVQQGLFDRVIGVGQQNGIGFDLPQFYVEGHIPNFLGTKGVDIKVGKWYTLVNYEVIPATGNFFYSHSYNFFFGPFNCTGALTTIHVTDTIDVYAGMFRGWEKWEDNNNRPSYTAALSWKSCDERILWFTAMQTGPEQNNNNSDYRTAVSSYVRTRFGCYNEWETVLLGNYSVDNNAVFNADGTERAARWYDTSLNVFYTVDPRLKLGSRLEWFRDQEGFRTGTPGTYYEWTVGFNYYPYQNLRIRPELRWDWSPNATPFNDGTDSNQYTIAADLIWQF